jgi:8-oxo-dGTP diphosphatase
VPVVAAVSPRRRPKLPARLGMPSPDRGCSDGVQQALYISMNNREVAAAVVIDSAGRLLLQQRDDVPGILYPGMVGLFGGHREGAETFLECVARELYEELSYFIPPERFDLLWSYDGPDWVDNAGWLRAEYFVVRDIPTDEMTVTEGSLLVVETSGLAELRARMTPATLRVLDVYLAKITGCDHI